MPVIGMISGRRVAMEGSILCVLSTIVENFSRSGSKIFPETLQQFVFFYPV